MSEDDSTRKSGSAFVSSLFDQIEAELIREHFLPLKQRYDDELRRIPRAHPNPAEYVKTRSKRYEEDFNHCESDTSLMLSLQVSRILSNITRGQETWPTAAQNSQSEQVPDKTVQESTPTDGAISEMAVCTDGSSDQTGDDQAPCASSPVLGAKLRSPPRAELNGPSLDDPFLDDPVHDDFDTRSITMMPLPAKVVCDIASLDKEPNQIVQEAVEAGDELDAEKNVSPEKNARSGLPTPKTPVAGDKRSQVLMKDWLSTDPSPASKRAKGSLASPFTPTRKVPLPFLTTKRQIVMADIKPGECVHKYGEHRGFYVLRCPLTACKQKLLPSVLGSAFPGNIKTPTCVVYFTANPLEQSRALSHFKSKGHKLTKLKEIYDKYAVRVTDADEAHNLGDADNTAEFLALSKPAPNRKRPVERTPSEPDVLMGARSPRPSASFKASDCNKDDDGTERRRQPTRAAAEAVTTYGPFTIDDEEKVVETVHVEPCKAGDVGDEIGRDYQSSDDDESDSDIPALTDAYARRFARV